MPDLTNDRRTALAQRRVMRRMFVWVEARDPETGDPSPAGFWDDAGDVDVGGRTYLGRGRIGVSSIKGESNVMRRMFVWVEARDPETGDPSPAGFWDDAGDVEVDWRTYLGRGRISVSSIKGESNLSIPAMTVTLSGVEPSAVALVNARSIAQAPVEVLFGIYDVDNHTLVPPLIRMFRGVVDEVDVRTPARGGRASIELICESIARALTVKRTETRSPESHKERAPADQFFDYTPGLRERTIYFGRREPNASKASARGGRTGGGS